MENKEIFELPISWACHHIPQGERLPSLNIVIEKIALRIAVLHPDEAPIVARVLKGAPDRPEGELGCYRVLRNNQGRASLYVSFVPELFPVFFEVQNWRKSGDAQRRSRQDYYLLRGELADLVGATISGTLETDGVQYPYQPYAAIQRSDVGQVIDSSRDEAFERLHATVEHMRIVDGVLHAPSTGPKILRTAHEGIYITESMWREETLPADRGTLADEIQRDEAARYSSHLNIEADGIFHADHQWHAFLRSVIDIYYNQKGPMTGVSSRYKNRHLGLSRRREELFREMGERYLRGSWPAERDKAFSIVHLRFFEIAYAENRYALTKCYAAYQTALAGLRDVRGPRPISERIEATGILSEAPQLQQLGQFSR
jgi:hypothetical protein